MAPEERKERMEMSLAVMPEAALMAVVAARRWAVRIDESMGCQE